MRTHTTVSGHRLEYAPTPAVATFLSRIDTAVGDAQVSSRDLTALAFSSENPILVSGAFKGRGAVTASVLADPAYHVMMDLLLRKQLAEEGGDVERIAERYSMTPSEAAAALGVDEVAIRDAIVERRLASWIKEGHPFIDPRSLSSFELVGRGTRGADVGGPLEIIMGHGNGRSLKIRTKEPIADVVRIEGNRLGGRLVKWQRVVVMTVARGSRRAFALEPGPLENEISHPPYVVRGRFVIREKANAMNAADRLWAETEVL